MLQLVCWMALLCLSPGCGGTSEPYPRQGQSHPFQYADAPPSSSYASHYGMEKWMCPKWAEWETSKCLWPTQDFQSYPASCTWTPKARNMPQWFQKFVELKNRENLDMMRASFKKQGGPEKKCGHCSRKIRCRVRSSLLQEDKAIPPWCWPAEKEISSETCEGSLACELDLVDGGCPPPTMIFHLFLEAGLPPPVPTQMMGPESGSAGPLPMMPVDHLGQPIPPAHYQGPPLQQPLPGQQIGGNSFPSPSTPSTLSSKPRPKRQTDIEMGMNMAMVQGYPPSNDTRGPPRKWNCVRNKEGNKCLCCCGYFFPNVDTGSCENIQGVTIKVPSGEPGSDQLPGTNVEYPLYPDRTGERNDLDYAAYAQEIGSETYDELSGPSK